MFIVKFFDYAGKGYVPVFNAILGVLPVLGPESSGICHRAALTCLAYPSGMTLAH